jgi:hypothetical protein
LGDLPSFSVGSMSALVVEISIHMVDVRPLETSSATLGIVVILEIAILTSVV